MAQGLDPEVDLCAETEIGTRGGPKYGQHKKWSFICLQMALVHESGWIPLERTAGQSFSMRSIWQVKKTLFRAWESETEKGRARGCYCGKLEHTSGKVNTSGSPQPRDGELGL